MSRVLRIKHIKKYYSAPKKRSAARREARVVGQPRQIVKTYLIKFGKKNRCVQRKHSISFFIALIAFFGDVSDFGAVRLSQTVKFSEFL